MASLAYEKENCLGDRELLHFVCLPLRGERALLWKISVSSSGIQELKNS